MFGSSHDPSWVAVAEKRRTWGAAMDAIGTDTRREDEERVGRRVVVGDILNPLNAPRSAALDLIVVVNGREGDNQKLGRQFRTSKIHLKKQPSGTGQNLEPTTLTRDNPSKALLSDLVAYSSLTSNLKGTKIRDQ